MSAHRRLDLAEEFHARAYILGVSGLRGVGFGLLSRFSYCEGRYDCLIFDFVHESASPWSSRQSTDERRYNRINHHLLLPPHHHHHHHHHHCHCHTIVIAVTITRSTSPRSSIIIISRSNLCAIAIMEATERENFTPVTVLSSISAPARHRLQAPCNLYLY